MTRLCGALARTNLALDFRGELVFSFFEFVIALQAKPEFRRGTEVMREAQRGVRRDRTLTLDDFPDPICRYAQIHREAMDTDAGRDDEVLVQDLTGMNRRYFPWASHV